MRYGIELHARGRQIVQCQAFDTLGDTHIDFEGFVVSKAPGKVTVCVPGSNNTKHTFSTIDPGTGYGYEGGVNSKRGWRILLSQLKTDKVPVVEGQWQKK